MYCKNETVFNNFRNNETYYAFLNVVVNQNNDYINILPIREKGLLIYKKNKEYNTYITYPELLMLEKYGIEFE